MRLFIFGFGYTGARLAARVLTNGAAVLATSRTREGREAIARAGATPVDPADREDLARALYTADTLLIAAPPGQDGCPGLRALEPLLALSGPRPSWIGYLSTTGVYGDRAGGWVMEGSELRPSSLEGRRRADAEWGWTELGARLAQPTAVFRLPGIYGPGRSALDRVRSGDARSVIKPGHVFSRIHVDDLADGLHLAAAARAPGPYNLCDDEPAAAAEVTSYAARLLGASPPREQPFDAEALSPAARRFWTDSKRVSNARAKAALGWRPQFPSYREGLAAILAAEQGEQRRAPAGGRLNAPS